MLHQIDGGCLFNLEEELQNGSLMCTTTRYRFSTCIFLLDLHRNGHRVLNSRFASAIEERLEMPWAWSRCSDATVIYPLLPRYCRGTLVEPQLWYEVFLDVILEPIMAWRNASLVLRRPKFMCICPLCACYLDIPANCKSGNLSSLP